MSTLHHVLDKEKRFYIPALDGLRFFAFLLVFIHHVPLKNVPVLSLLNRIGWIGVDIFFCLSAFLLTRLLSIEHNRNNRIHIWNFFIRRTLRVWPLYFAYVIFLPLLYFILQPDPENFFTREVGLLTFTDNIFSAFNGFNPIPATGHLWTISYEEQFYLTLPFLFIFLITQSKSAQTIILISLFLAGAVCRLLFIYLDVKDPAIWVLPITHMESVCIGIFFGLNNPSAWKKVVPLSLLISIAATAAIFVLPDASVTSYHLMLLYPLIGVAAGGAFLSVLSAEVPVMNKFLSHTIIVFLGKISFGLYVFHAISIYSVYYWSGWNNRWEVVTLTSLLLTIALATASYYFLERPFLNFKKKFTAVLSRPV